MTSQAKYDPVFSLIIEKKFHALKVEIIFFIMTITGLTGPDN